MDTMILQFHHGGSPPELEEVRDLFGLDPTDVDEEYGVVGTDPANGLYTVLVSSEAEDKVRLRLKARPHHRAEGLFGNPRIETTRLEPPGTAI